MGKNVLYVMEIGKIHTQLNKNTKVVIKFYAFGRECCECDARLFIPIDKMRELYMASSTIHSLTCTICP